MELRKALGDSEQCVIAREGEDIVHDAAAFEVDALLVLIDRTPTAPVHEAQCTASQPLSRCELQHADTAGVKGRCDMSRHHDQDLATEPNLAMSTVRDATSSA